MDYATFIRTYDILSWCLDDLEDVLDNFNEDFKDWLSKKTEGAEEQTIKDLYHLCQDYVEKYEELI